MEGRREIEGEERRKGETEGRKEGRRNESLADAWSLY